MSLLTIEQVLAWAGRVETQRAQMVMAKNIKEGKEFNAIRVQEQETKPYYKHK